MEFLLSGKRPPVELAGVFAPIITRAWLVEEERVDMSGLLELLRHPLVSGRSHLLHLHMPRPHHRSAADVANKTVPISTQQQQQRERELVGSMPALARASSSGAPAPVPALRRIPFNEKPVAVRVRSTSLSSSSYSESGSPDLSRSSSGSAPTPPVRPPESPWLTSLPRCKHEKMQHVPNLEQW
jgi:hypothetical protein